MAKYEFKVGDRVQFKEWDEMGKEFGFCTDGDINTKCLFKKEMRHFCGTYATIADLIPFAGHPLVILCNFTTTGDTCWNITPDMLKPASTKKQAVDEPKTKEAYGFKHGDKVKYGSMVCTVVGKHKTLFNALTIKLPDGKGGHSGIDSEEWEKFEGEHYWFDFADRLTRVEDKPTTHEHPTITAHIIEGKKTTVMLSDGRMGEVTCYYKDEFDPAVGLAEAYKKALDIAKAEDKHPTPKPKFEVSKKYVTGTDLEGYKPDDSKKLLLFDARHYGIIGTPTILKTSNGEPLFVGDQVQISSSSHTPDHLNMVCHNDKYNDFIMGIVCDCRSNESIKDAGWSVNLVKRYTELKAGDNVEYTSKDFKVLYENPVDTHWL